MMFRAQSHRSKGHESGSALIATVLRPTAQIVISLMLLVGVAAPAAANGVGMIPVGSLTVGKQRTFCDDDGRSDPSGPGLGLPVFNGIKQAYYRAEVLVTIVNEPTKGTTGGVSTGVLDICGRLGWVGRASSGAALGAACGMSRGHDGQGRILYTSGPAAEAQPYYLRDISWPASAGMAVAFKASGQHDAIEAGGSGTDLVTGVLRAQGAESCLTKAGSGNDKSGGGTMFVVVGEIQMVNDGWQGVGP